MTFSRTLHTVALSGITLLTLSACVYTNSDIDQKSAQTYLTSRSVKNAGDISISENAPTNRKYQVVGTVNATARSVNLLSSDPTREDINEELRASAFKIGADAVILVKYQTARQGMASRGHMTATGQAVVFTN